MRVEAKQEELKFKPITLTITLETLEEVQDLYNVSNYRANCKGCKQLKVSLISEKLVEFIGYDTVRGTFDAYVLHMNDWFK
jgi:hypothetical protein